MILLAFGFYCTPFLVLMKFKFLFKKKKKKAIVNFHDEEN